MSGARNEPTATEAIDADLAAHIETLCKEAERAGHGETVVALVASTVRRAYMYGWYRGHQCASDLAARIETRVGS